MTKPNAFRQTRFQPGSAESTDVLAALAASDLSFTAELVPVLHEDQDAIGGVAEIPDRYLSRRADTREPFDIVGGSYEPVQYSAALGWIQPLLDSGEARIISAGYTGRGAHGYVQAELVGSMRDVLPGDPVFSSVNFTAGHDGRIKVRAGTSRTRVVCRNTMAMMAASLQLSFRHTRGVHDALEAARTAFHAELEQADKAAELFRGLARRTLSDRNLVRYVRETLSPGAGNDESIAVKGVDRIVELAHVAPGATPGNMWGGLNAVTYWATHERGRSEDSRQDSLLFGKGGQLIERATAVAVQYAERLPYAEMGRAASNAHATASLEFGSLLGRRSVVLDQQGAAE